MLFTDCLLHALEDTARLLPFLFLTYLVMEYLEQRAGERSARAVRRRAADDVRANEVSA